jgi:uncharacterized membrane protein
MYSTTYAAVIVAILAQLLPRFGVQIGTEELTSVITLVVQAAAGAWVLVQRYRRGDITPLGVRK